FKLLDYELSIPLDYTVKKCTFSFIPAFAIPVNPAVVTVNVKASAASATVSKTSTEKLDNSFFATFQLSYKF
ncbi:MAG: hypothetical protein JST39_00700, partial [Bacteroidetes bacterium]|nr:hypothetical protein [Bacteroidota bacterium]